MKKTLAVAGFLFLVVALGAGLFFLATRDRAPEMTLDDQGAKLDTVRPGVNPPKSTVISDRRPAPWKERNAETAETAGAGRAIPGDRDPAPENEESDSRPAATGDERALAEALARDEAKEDLVEVGGTEQRVTSLFHRAEVNGIPVKVQQRIDRQRDKTGTLWSSGGNFTDLHDRYDIGRALLARLMKNPYNDIAWDIAELPDEQYGEINQGVRSVAFDEKANPMNRKTAVQAMGIRYAKDSSGACGVMPEDLLDIVRHTAAPDSVRITAARYLVEKSEMRVVADLKDMLQGRITEAHRFEIRTLIKKLDPGFE